MSVGQLARRLLGERWFSVVGKRYRAIFVDLDKVVDNLPAPPPGAAILDVGGGDGAVVDGYLARHPEARVTMIDLAPRIGTAIRAEVRDRVELLPSTSVKAYAALGRRPPDIVLISDVVHHVPEAERRQFFRDVRDLVAGRPCTLVIKDVQPGSPRAFVALMADRYVSGDRNTKFLPEREMIELVTGTVPHTGHTRTPLLDQDSPNYCLVFHTAGPDRQAAFSATTTNSL